jgi:hypothetical protein
MRDGYKKTEYMERENISRVCGPVAEQGMWITRNNQELREVRVDLDIVVYMKKKRLVWMDI